MTCNPEEAYEVLQTHKAYITKDDAIQQISTEDP